MCIIMYPQECRQRKGAGFEASMLPVHNKLSKFAGLGVTVCIHVTCVCVCIHVTCVCVCMHTCDVCVCIHVTCVCMHTCDVCVCVSVCVHAYM